MYSQFREKVVENMQTFKVNADDDAFIGPLQNRIQFDRVDSLLDDIRSQDSIAISAAFNMPKTGYFINPTIADNPPDESQSVQGEPFGELCCIVKYFRKISR